MLKKRLFLIVFKTSENKYANAISRLYCYFNGQQDSNWIVGNWVGNIKSAVGFMNVGTMQSILFSLSLRVIVFGTV